MRNHCDPLMKNIEIEGMLRKINGPLWFDDLDSNTKNAIKNALRTIL